MAAATIEDGNSTYNGCSAATSSEGLRYFYGPQCTDDGDLTMGFYFDKYCQLNATRRGNIYSPESFISFGVFYFVQSICSDCSYFGVCEDIYTSSYGCRTNYGTLLSIGDDIAIDDEDEEEENNADGVERRVQEDDYEEEVYEEKAEGAKEETIRSTTLSFAEEVCFEINYLEHLQEELLRNTTTNYLKEGGMVLKDLSKIMCGIGAILGVGFLFVAHTYYARHKARWAESKRGALNDDWHDAKSFDEISVASTDAGFSAIDESIPSPMRKC